jgi:hypothetical protein
VRHGDTLTCSGCFSPNLEAPPMSQRLSLQIPALRSGRQKKRRVLLNPIQANGRLEWGTQPSLPAKNDSARVEMQSSLTRKRRSDTPPPRKDATKDRGSNT